MLSTLKLFDRVIDSYTSKVAALPTKDADADAHRLHFVGRRMHNLSLRIEKLVEVLDVNDKDAKARLQQALQCGDKISNLISLVEAKARAIKAEVSKKPG